MASAGTVAVGAAGVSDEDEAESEEEEAASDRLGTPESTANCRHCCAVLETTVLARLIAESYTRDEKNSIKKAYTHPAIVGEVKQTITKAGLR